MSARDISQSGEAFIPFASTKAKVVDLCCGLGGLSVAAREMGMRVVAGVDVNPSALRTFSRNFPEAEAIEGSVRSRTVLERCRALLDGDGDGLSVVLSGPPCQGFSAAGSRDPKDRRNGVLVAVARAIARIQPDCAVIENVSTVLAEKHGERLESFREVLAGVGYHVEKKVLDSSEYGVPQKRKRAFFFVTRRPLDPRRIDDLLARHKVPPVMTRAALHGLAKCCSVRPASRERVRMNYHRQPSTAHREPSSLLPGPMSYRRLHPTKPANTLFSGHRAPPAHFAEPRSITVREAARLQGFPDTFRVYGSFANQMEQVTNAVPPPLACAVVSVLIIVSGVQDQCSEVARNPHGKGLSATREAADAFYTRNIHQPRLPILRNADEVCVPLP
jgi:DNA (cytosine-5)-methyltransferase 1